jgi:hypothetical protein
MPTNSQRRARTLLTPSCSFKLYDPLLLRSAEPFLRGVALTWIDEPTAGFVCAERCVPFLAVYWWEGQMLRRLRCHPSAPSRRPTFDAFTVASVEEMALLAFEAARWSRHVSGGHPPSINSYLAEFYR